MRANISLNAILAIKSELPSGSKAQTLFVDRSLGRMSAVQSIYPHQKEDFRRFYVLIDTRRRLAS